MRIKSSKVDSPHEVDRIIFLHAMLMRAIYSVTSCKQRKLLLYWIHELELQCENALTSLRVHINQYYDIFTS